MHPCLASARYLAVLELPASTNGAAATACTGPASAPPAAAEGPAQAACDAEAVRWAGGETGGEKVVERARRGAGARTVRVLPPGMAATMDFNPLRLDLVTDEGLLRGLIARAAGVAAMAVAEKLEQSITGRRTGP